MISRKALPALPEPEFSRRFDIGELAGKRAEVDLQATESECHALAARFEVVAIKSLRAHLILMPFASGNKVALKADFEAEVEQACVVTLEPVISHPKGGFLAEFVPPAFDDRPEEVEFEINEDDPPEPIVDGKIEVGELIAQHLGLEIDPFPRAPGAVFEGLTEDTAGPSEPRPNPFAALAGLKTSKN